MKKVTFLILRSFSVGGLFVIAVVINLNVVSAQDSWVQKNNFRGHQRHYAVGFSIGDMGYIGLGVHEDDDTKKKDFWKYNPSKDSWAQVANFGGMGRVAAVGFSIGNKGYVGTGADDDLDYKKDFWEYNPSDNTWTQKADFGGTARAGAVGFSIGDKGYLGTRNDVDYVKDFWEYDPANDSWTQKANMGGVIGRNHAVGFSIGSKGYIGSGLPNYNNNFWEYDPSTNIWTEKAYLFGYRWGAVGFSIGDKGYFGTGFTSGSDGFSHVENDLWEYDPSADTWTQKADLEGVARGTAVGFSIGNKGYIGTGRVHNYDNVDKGDFWEYTPENLSCMSPVYFSVTNITSSSVTLNWGAVAGAEGYKVRYKVANTSVWTKKNATGTSKIISELSPNTEYKWEVKSYCHIDSPSVSSDWSAKQSFTTTLRLADEPSPQPSFQLYPNPAKDYATIQYTLNESSYVSIKVFDASGKEIKSVMDDDAEQGTHTVPLNLKDFHSGIYFVRMISDFGSETQKLMVQ